jgi:two-component system sensor kinase FixL
MSSSRVETVLVVDDDADTRANLRDVLELDDYRVETAATASELWTRSDWSKVSIVILDRRLPDGNAREILPRLKAVAPHVSVIIITGFADLESAMAALRHGAEDYILKPINVEELRTRLGHVAERRRTQRALEESEQRFRQFAENIDQVFWMYSEDAQTVYYVSPAYETIWGRSRASLYENPHSWVDAIHPDDRARAERFYAATAAGGGFDEEYRVLRPDGSIRWVRDRMFLVEGSAGTGRLLAGIAADVTERKESAERALQAERLAAIGETMTGLAHESRNALQRSKACLEMLVLEVEDRPEALDLVARAMRAQNHLQQLYEEVRQYAAPIVLERERVNLCGLWREVWADVTQTHSEKRIALREECDGVAPESEVDRFAMGRVFRNILENAVDAAPDNSEICIHLSSHSCDNGPRLRIAFRDKGPGIPREHHDRIFDPFFTTKTKGTGLGMAIAQRIVHSHGGQIAVEEQTEGGTEIAVTLPRGNV